jgi:hypothetical protein
MDGYAQSFARTPAKLLPISVACFWCFGFFNRPVSSNASCAEEMVS